MLGVRPAGAGLTWAMLWQCLERSCHCCGCIAVPSGAAPATPVPPLPAQVFVQDEDLPGRYRLAAERSSRPSGAWDSGEAVVVALLVWGLALSAFHQIPNAPFHRSYPRAWRVHPARRLLVGCKCMPPPSTLQLQRFHLNPPSPSPPHITSHPLHPLPSPTPCLCCCPLRQGRRWTSSSWRRWVEGRRRRARRSRALAWWTSWGWPSRACSASCGRCRSERAASDARWGVVGCACAVRCGFALLTVDCATRLQRISVRQGTQQWQSGRCQRARCSISAVAQHSWVPAPHSTSRSALR